MKQSAHLQEEKVKAFRDFSTEWSNSNYGLVWSHFENSHWHRVHSHHGSLSPPYSGYVNGVLHSLSMGCHGRANAPSVAEPQEGPWLLLCLPAAPTLALSDWGHAESPFGLQGGSPTRGHQCHPQNTISKLLPSRHQNASVPCVTFLRLFGLQVTSYSDGNKT
jgi:hypothetical protein